MAPQRPVLEALSNIDTERAVLGCCLIDKEAFLQVWSILRMEDLSLREHRMIYQAMLRLSARGVTVDLTAVDADLDARGETEQAGGTAYLAQLMDWAFYGMNVVDYVGIVRDRAKRRKLARWCEKLGDELLGAYETEELLSKAHEQILALRFDRGGGRLPFVAAKEAAVRAFGEIDCQAANPKKFTLCVS